MASVISAPLPAYPRAAIIRIDASKDCMRILVLSATIQLARSAPEIITTSTPKCAHREVPDGIAPKRGNAGIE
ncbi:unannotated protein [freshwater metagenome]|uniref:Unannotated protein n=1 Tax=freshwater metagenome TaxID=449393 RepID=A0A6J6LFK9_9ZZZZ